MKEVALVLKRIDGRLPELFPNAAPHALWSPRPVPDYIAPQTTTAYYMPPPGDGSRAGFYYVNTFDLKSRPLYEHSSLVLARSRSRTPPANRLAAGAGTASAVSKIRRLHSVYRRLGLYAERLGLEVGFYEDPYSDFGRLTYEMWRACRLGGRYRPALLWVVATASDRLSDGKHRTFAPAISAAKSIDTSPGRDRPAPIRSGN